MSKKQARKRAARRGSGSLDTIGARMAEASAALCVPDSQTLAEWTERYRAIRRKGLEFTKPLIGEIPREVMDHTAEELGILQQRTYVFESEEETNVLMDHALHFAPRGGVSTVESYFREHPPAPGTDDEAMARGFLSARFVLCLIVERFPGFGLEVRDLLTDRPFLVADIHMSQSNCVGLTLTGRLHPLDDFWMFSGAMVPVVHSEAFERIAQYFDRVLGGWRSLDRLPPDRRRLAESFILRTCLEYHPFEQMRTVNV